MSNNLTFSNDSNFKVDVDKIYVNPFFVSGLDKVTVNPGVSVVFSTRPDVAISPNMFPKTLESLRYTVEISPCMNDFVFWIESKIKDLWPTK